MRAAIFADVQVTGPVVQYFFLALIVPTCFLIRLIVRTSPRTVAQPLSPFETAVAPWLWARHRDRRATVLAAIAAAGGAICTAAAFLPVLTFTDPPLFAGDPLAGPSEHDPSARALALALGVVLGLLALRRAAGGEGITVPITLLFAMLLGLVAVLAWTDYLSNDYVLPDRFAPSVAAGPGMVVLTVGAALTLAGCAADLMAGLRSARAPRAWRPAPGR